MKQLYIKAFIIMLVLMTVLLILSYTLIGFICQILAFIVMLAGFVLCLKNVSADGITAKKVVFSLASAVGAMLAAQFISWLAAAALFWFASSDHHI